MSKQTEKNLFIVSSLPALYQDLLRGMASYQELGNRIIKQIKAAHAFRRVDRVQELSTILMNIPIKEHQLIGQYYLAWCYCRKGTSQAKTFEHIAEQSQTYKAQSFLSRAAIEGYQGNIDSELYFYTEALKTRPNLTEYMRASIGIAVIKSKEGLHKNALKDIENLIPLTKYVEPILHYDFLIELGEAGRLNEARNVSKVVLASPFAFAYPEWLETAEELRPASRSFAVIKPSKIRRAKLLQMPKIELGEPSELDRPASVVNIQTWKANMDKEKNGDKSLDELDSRQLLLRLMELGTAQGMTDDKLYKVITMMEKLLAEPDEPQKPDDDPGA